MEEFLKQIQEETKEVVLQLLEVSNLKKGNILVAGCSSSEIGSFQIGSHSSAEIGKAVFEVLYGELKKKGIYLAAQCCEHLNRALIIEAEAAEKYGYEPVNVVPQLKAGGSFATAAYEEFKNPVAVEEIRAHAGIDIGHTLIGMHLRPVAVPVRTATSRIGSAPVVCARTRARYIGGIRAKYKE